MVSVMFLRTLTIGTLATAAHGLNILLTNDDSWASANIRYVHIIYSAFHRTEIYIRATYDALKNDGHDVLLVA